VQQNVAASTHEEPNASFAEPKLCTQLQVEWAILIPPNQKPLIHWLVNFRKQRPKSGFGMTSQSLVTGMHTSERGLLRRIPDCNWRGA
jgi:hypothetical protein